MRVRFFPEAWLSVLVGILLFSESGYSQEFTVTPWSAQASVSALSKAQTLALSGWRRFATGKRKQFGLSLGLRYNLAFNQNAIFRTAPARLTSGQQGPQVLFAEDIPANIDTFRVNRGVFHSLNLGIALDWQFHSRWGLTFSIDAAGFSAGPKRSGTFSTRRSGMFTEQELQAKPYRYNLLLISDNDLGSLNSELFVSWFLNQNMQLRAGATFLFTEYQTETKPALDNNRFRHKSLQPMLGLSWQF
jgi:hypothetical protein